LSYCGQAAKGLEEEIADEEALSEPSDLPYAVVRQPSEQNSGTTSNKIFVVHGHDEAALQTVARFLEKLGLEAIILREQPDSGRTIIEKFEDYADEVGFAVVLLTPDDIAESSSTQGSGARARQNVIFELGYFAGKLGRGRACLLRKGEVEIPSDLYGVIYTELDAGGGWKLKLVQELKATNLDFDANKMWG
jgi:predicted nucleotide-binding protein